MNEIRYHYGAWQKRYEEIEKSDQRYTFISGVPSEDDLPSGDYHTVMVIDDLMEEVAGKKSSKTTGDIFTKHSHHRNMTVIYIVQKLYGNSHMSRVISQNAHIIILFKNPRDVGAVRTLGAQMFPANNGFLVEAFRDATSKPYSYLVVNAHQRTDERMRVLGNVFELEGEKAVYIPK